MASLSLACLFFLVLTEDSSLAPFSIPLSHTFTDRFCHDGVKDVSTLRHQRVINTKANYSKL
ncbi:hypothetical protein BLOT_013382 [Blomia tropicalis]|nr:hypothetical protein BLOT_013382 [Blomia tropicalis]